MPVGAATSEGCHELIQQGAKLVTRAQDIIDELSPEIAARLRPVETGAPEPASLTEDEQRVLARLPRYGASDSDALSPTGLTTSRILAALSGLELKGLVRAHPGGTYARATR